MKRFGQIIGVKPEKFQEYARAHAAVWPEVLEMITQCNIKNYSIFHHESKLFAYFEYHGDNFEADMERMAAHPKTQEWWDWMMPLQEPLETRGEGEWWVTMDEVFHHK